MQQIFMAGEAGFIRLDRSKRVVQLRNKVIRCD